MSSAKSVKRTTHAEHHLILRIRKGEYSFKFIDKVIVFSGPLVPIAIFFQAYQIWLAGDASNLSLATWLLLLFSSVTLATYSVYHRAAALMMTYAPLVVANTTVVVGILLLS